MAKDLTGFLKGNVSPAENKKVIVSDRFMETDETGEVKAIEWELKTITSKADREIRCGCYYQVPVKGKKGMTRQEFNAELYADKLVMACIVFPDLKSVELQDSYGVKNELDLLGAMLIPGELTDLRLAAQEVCGFEIDKGLEEQELKDEAKNY